MKGDLVLCAGGMTVWASLPGDGTPRLKFGDDPVIQIPEASNGLAACLTPSGYVAVVRGHHDHAFLITRNRTIQHLGGVIGTNSVGVIPSGDIFWIVNTRQYRRMRAGVITTMPVPLDANGQSVSGQGWTQILDNGEIVWTDKMGTRRVEGKLLTRCVRVGDWTIGMDTSAPRIVAYQHVERSWWLVANTHTQSGPQAVLIHGEPWVAISGDPCFFVRRDQFQLLAQSEPPPPPQNEDDMTDAQWKELQAFMRNMRDAMGDLQEAVDDLREQFEETPPSQPVPTPPSSDAPVIDLARVNWLYVDVSGWAETALIQNVTITKKPDDNKSGYRDDNYTVCFPHTKALKWPAWSDGEAAGEGNVWVFGFVNGRWHAGCAEWLKPGQTCKRFSNRTEKDSWGLGPHVKKDPLKTWGPKSGEWIGFMVSTRARDSMRSVDADGREVLERSNVYMTRWP